MQRHIRRGIVSKIMPFVKQIQGMSNYKNMKDEDEDMLEMEDEELNDRHVNEQGFKKVSNYENVISKLSGSLSISDVLDIYQENQHLFRNEHIALCLRMMARHVKYARKDFKNDPRYLELQNTVVAKYDSFDEFELQDLLFWLRKFRMANISTYLVDRKLDNIISCVKQMVEKKNYNFRHLINIYYDVIHLGRSMNEVIDQIYQDISNDIKLLTPFSVNQLLQSFAYKKYQMNYKDFKVMEIIYQEIIKMIGELEIYQKCLIFRNISVIQLVRPIYNELIINLSNDLTDKLDQMQEINVISCVKAFQNLPNTQDPKLILQIQEMIQITLQHNKENIKSNFLIDYLIESGYLQNRFKLSSANSKLLIDEISSRLYVQQILSKKIFLGRLIQVGNLYQNHELLDKVQSFMVENNIVIFKTMDQLTVLNRNINDLLQIVTKINYKIININLVEYYLLVRYSNIYHNFKQQNLENQLFQDITANGIINVRNICDQLERLQVNMNVRTLINQYIWTQISDLEKDQIKLIQYHLYFILDNDNINTIYEYFNKQNIELINTKFNKKNIFEIQMINNFFKIEKPNYLQFSLINQIVQNCNNPLVIQRYFDSLRQNRSNLIQSNLITFNNIKSLYFVIKKYLDLNQQESKSNFNILQFICSLQEYDTEIYQNQNSKEQSIILKSFLKNLLQRIKKDLIDQKKFDTIKPEEVFLFLSNNLIESNEYETVVNLINQHSKNQFINIPILASLLQQEKNQTTYLKLKDIVDKLIEKYIEHNKKKIFSNKFKDVIFGIQSILKLPVDFYVNEQDIIIKAIKDNIPQTNFYLFKQIVNCLDIKLLKSGKSDFKSNLFKELFSQQSRILLNQKNQATVICFFMETFQRLKIKHPSYLNQIFVAYGNSFEQFKISEKIQILKQFSYMRLKQEDVFQQSIKDIYQKCKEQGSYFSILLAQSCFILGLNNEELNENIIKIKQIPKNINNFNDICYLICYIQLNIKDNSQLLKSIIQMSQGILDNIKQKKVNNSFLTFLNIYEQQNPEDYKQFDFLNTIKKEINYYNKTNNNIKNMFSKFLDTMGVQYKQIEHELGDYLIESQKKIIFLLNGYNFNYDRESISGELKLQGQLAQLKYKDYDVLYIISDKFNPNGHTEINPLHNVIFLNQQGIASNNQQNNYDFSFFKKNERIQQDEEDDLPHITEDIENITLDDISDQEIIKKDA